jgi:hypothetical protein
MNAKDYSFLILGCVVVLVTWLIVPTGTSAPPARQERR